MDRVPGVDGLGAAHRYAVHVWLDGWHQLDERGRRLAVPRQYGLHPAQSGLQITSHAVAGIVSPRKAIPIAVISHAQW